MKKRLHHIALLFFLSFLSLPFVALLLLQGTQWYLKSRADERMKTERLETVSIHLSSIWWEKPEKEFWVDGKLFDVKGYTIANGKLTATGFFDHEETGVFNLLTLWHKAKKSGGMYRLFFLFQCFAAFVVIVRMEGLLRTRHRQINFILSACLPSPFLLVRKQPPRC